MSFYFSFLAEKFFMIQNEFFGFSDHPNHVVTNLLQPAPPLSRAEICDVHGYVTFSEVYYEHII